MVSARAVANDMRESMERVKAAEPVILKLLGGDRIMCVEGSDDEVLAGVIVYDCGRVVHTQYLAASERGRATGALDHVVTHLISQTYADREYFDFGISTEHDGHCLNPGLTFQKESFGGRGVCYDTWELNLLPQQ